MNAGQAQARRLLILDDDELVGMLLQTIAQLDGMTVDLTASPQSFFARLDAAPPSHIVLDLTLPDTSGEQILQALSDRHCRARIILSSGVDAMRLQEAAALAGRLGLACVGSLPKPFTPMALRGLLAAS